jgi:hypothetical protein
MHGTHIKIIEAQQAKIYIYKNIQLKLLKTNAAIFFFFWSDGPQWALASSFTRFLDHTQRHTTFGRTSLDE